MLTYSSSIGPENGKKLLNSSPILHQMPSFQTFKSSDANNTDENSHKSHETAGDSSQDVDQSDASFTGQETPIRIEKDSTSSISSTPVTQNGSSLQSPNLHNTSKNSQRHTETIKESKYLFLDGNNHTSTKQEPTPRNVITSFLNTSPTKSHIADFAPHEILNKENLLASISHDEPHFSPVSSIKTKASHNILDEFAQLSIKTIDTPTPNERFNKSAKTFLADISAHSISEENVIPRHETKSEVSIKDDGSELSYSNEDYTADNSSQVISRSIQSQTEDELPDRLVLPQQIEPPKPQARVSSSVNDDFSPFNVSVVEELANLRPFEEEIDKLLPLSQSTEGANSSLSTFPTSKASSSKIHGSSLPSKSPKHIFESLSTQEATHNTNDHGSDDNLTSVDQESEHSQDEEKRKEFVISSSLSRTSTKYTSDRNSLEKYHNSTLNADYTEFNDTLAQLEQDFDLDSISIASKNRHHDYDNGNTAHIPHSKLVKSPSSPWSKIRSFLNNTHFSSEMYPRVQEGSLFGSRKQSFMTKTTQDASSSEKVDELNKEITSYKIQLKFFKQFIQDLIDKNRNGNQDIASLLDINNIVSMKSEMALENEKHANLEIDFRNLQANYDEVYKLNEDLYESLENFESTLKTKDEQLHSINVAMDNISQIVDSILYTLINYPIGEESSKSALYEASQDFKPSDYKLQVIQAEMDKILECNYRLSTANTEQREVAKHIEVIERLLVSIEQLKKEMESQKEERGMLEKELQKEVEESKRIKTDFQVISQKFNNLCKTLNESEEILVKRSTGDANEGAYRYEQDRTSNMQGSVSEDTRDSYDTSNSNDPITRIKAYEEAINKLNGELQQWNVKYQKLQSESTDTINSLSAQLQHKQQDISNLKIEEREWKQANSEINILNESNRALKTEKYRLSNSVETLLKENRSLQEIVHELNTKVLEGNEGNQASKKLNYVEFQLKELISYDVTVFQKLWKSFDKIAEDNSFKEPTRRLNVLKRYLKDEHDPNSPDYQNGSNYVREQHKYISEYFARAVEILVNDHVKLLLQNEDEDAKTRDYISSLTTRIGQLEKINDKISKQIEISDVDESYSATLDVSKIKLEEMSTRFKAEREQRVYENNQAQRRLKELELENAKLRQMLNNT